MTNLGTGRGDEPATAPLQEEKTELRTRHEGESIAVLAPGSLEQLIAAIGDQLHAWQER